MRVVFYNIRYGTGSDWNYHFPLPFSGFFRCSSTRIRRIAEFLNSLHADIICLVEVDGGSYRHGKHCQARYMASLKGWQHRFSGKYGSRSVLNDVPILSSQGNAILTRLPIVSSAEHNFSKGMKRTFLEVEFDTFHVVLAHLSLGKNARQTQLKEMAEYCSSLTKPVILGGDFNLLHGSSELQFLSHLTGLREIDPDKNPTFPSRMPKLKLDYLLAGKTIHIKNMEIPRIHLSDHLPMVCDFNVGGEE